MRNIQLIDNLPYNLPPIVDVTDILPHSKEGTWLTLPTRNVDGKPVTGPRKAEDLNTIVIHHTASDAPLINQALYHINTHKWPGIAYHLIIDEGKIKQCNDLLAFTWHVASHNANTVAICVNADLSKRELTQQERQLLYAAILTVKSVLPIKQILGHNQLNPTACPCTNMDTIRKDIIDLEHQIQYQQSPNNARATAYSVAEETLYLYNLAQGKDSTGKPVSDGTQQWAIEMLLQLAGLMRENKLIK